MSKSYRAIFQEDARGGCDMAGPMLKSAGAMEMPDTRREPPASSPRSTPATLRIEFMVPSARWSDFEATAQEMGNAATALGGALGVDIVTLGTARGDRHVMAALLFADKDMLDRWRVLPEAAMWRAKLENLACDRPVIKLRSGVEVWLSSSVQRYADPPPRYKTALLGLIAVYPSLLLQPGTRATQTGTAIPDRRVAVGVRDLGIADLGFDAAADAAVPIMALSRERVRAIVTAVPLRHPEVLAPSGARAGGACAGADAAHDQSWPAKRAKALSRIIEVNQPDLIATFVRCHTADDAGRSRRSRRDEHHRTAN